MAADIAEPDVLAWARYYHELGLHVFPLSPKTKIPPKGFPLKRYQTTRPTLAEIESWFSTGHANIGILLGRGLVAVDLDGEGAEELLNGAGITLPDDAPRSRTSDGYHVILRVGADVGDRVAMLCAGYASDGKPIKPQVDIRGVGYIVAPPSIHPSGHVYEWEHRVSKAIPACPQALIDLIGRTGSPAKPSAAAAGPSDAPQWVSAALPGVGEGKRDATCARLAGYFLGKGVPADIVKAQLYAFGDRCRPAYSRKDVDKTVNSVDRKDAARVQAVDANAPFQVLGYNAGTYYYLPRGSRQVVELRADQHTKLHFLRLAPLKYWEESYANKKGVEWDMAANAMLRRAEAAGIYDTARIRGRGAWWDGADAVLHVGDALITAGVKIPLGSLPSGRFIYEASSPLPIDMDSPLDAEEANKIVQMAELVNWERPISARLLAGWCAIAPICGAVGWRPHIWLTGAAGTGKTWVIEHIVRKLCAEIGLAVQSETTEAGLRQTLGHDARPVIFDEIEGEDMRAQMRVQNVLALARQASSETGAVIIKGSPMGGARTYRIRSCFAFSSIGVGVEKYADSTRVSVLSIERRNDPKRFAKLSALALDTVTEDYARRFIARSIRLVPQIRANAVTFARAGAEVIGSQRLGDQIGALLAGCYSLFDDGVIDAAEATKWVREQDWTEQRGVQDDTDETACLRSIVETTIKVQTPRSTVERTIAELIRHGSSGTLDLLAAVDANDALGRLGIKVGAESFTISNSHKGIAGILEGTPWAKGWRRTLQRLPGAVVTAGTVRFGATVGRGVTLPLQVLS